MSLKVIKCPNCNANISFEQDATNCHCDYCGSGFVVEDGVIRVNIKNQFVDEARVKQIELQQVQLEARLELLKEERKIYEERRSNWMKWLIAVLVVVGICIAGLMVFSNTTMTALLTGLLIAVGIVGGIALYVLKPKEPENAQSVISRVNRENRILGFDNDSLNGTRAEKLDDERDEPQFDEVRSNNYRKSMRRIESKFGRNGGSRNQQVLMDDPYENRDSGYRRQGYRYGVSRKNKVVALLLCIFFGYFGLHHFYCGRMGKGFLYLFTVGLFYIGWMYDIYLIASGNYVDGDGLYVI